MAQLKKVFRSGEWMLMRWTPKPRMRDVMTQCHPPSLVYHPFAVGVGAMSQTPMQVNVTGLFIWAVRIVTLRTSRVGPLAVNSFHIGMRIEPH